MNKDRLIKYGEFLREKMDPWTIKNTIRTLNSNIESVSIPGDLKALADGLNGELSGIKLPYNKIVHFGGIDIDLNITQSNRYYSNIDWFEFLNGNNRLVIEVPSGFDKEYLLSLLIHEIRHMIDFTDENTNNNLTSFDIELNLRKYKIPKFDTFYRLVYITLEHELVARNNQIYPFIKFKSLTKDESIKILKTSFIWKALEELEKFDQVKFISLFDEIQLTEITNEFIKDCLHDDETKIEDGEDLVKFYEIWDEYFREVSDKWKTILLKEVDYVYERKCFDIEYSVMNDYKKILNEIWTEIKNKSLY